MKITLRDKIAIAAMQAIISKTKHEVSIMCDGSEKEHKTSRGAYSYADAMLAERDK